MGHISVLRDRGKYAEDILLFAAVNIGHIGS